MPRERYSSALKEVLREIDETQGPAIDAAASLIVESVVNGGTWDLYDTGHMLMREAVGRAGGLTMVTPIRVEVRVEHESRPRAIPPNPKRLFLDQIRDLPEYILARAQLDAGHVLMIGSVSGVNLLPVELAVRARLMGVKTIGLTSVSAFARMTPQHEGGRPAMACERALLAGPRRRRHLHVASRPQERSGRSGPGDPVPPPRSYPVGRHARPALPAPRGREDP